MANQYTDLHVIECNRLHSEEAKSGNNENFALWQNNLQDIVHLDAGDKVSVHGAMVSEKGAGQPSSIEIKGESLGVSSTFKYTTLKESVYDKGEAGKLINGNDVIDVTEITDTKELFDNKGYFTMSYFVPANGHNYIELPRRFWYSEYNSSLTDFTSENYASCDSQSKGMTLADPFGMLDSGLPSGITEPDRWDLYDDYYQIEGLNTNASLSKVRNDNSRYTIMIREHTYYSSNAANNYSDNMPDEYLREPENHNYYVYRELKEIEAPTGFNSPDFLSTEITRQLQKVVSTNLFNFRDLDDKDADNQYTPGWGMNITKSISTETYKPFNVAGYLGKPQALQPSGKTIQEEIMDNFINTTGGTGFDYLQAFHVIGCKRPELYETGRLINRNPTSPYDLNKVRGSRLQANSNGTYFDFSLPYDNKDILDNFRDFIYAQEKYPEIWNIFSDSRTRYRSGDTIDNSRWCHINRFPNASMTFYNGSDTDDIDNFSTLGFGGYKFPTWNASQQSQKSMILPFKYDPEQRNIYYESPNEDMGQYTYGCFGRNASGFIRVYGTPHNGKGSNLLAVISDAVSVIESGRKIGFDQHFSAPGMTYILPCDMRPDQNAITNASNNGFDDTNVNGPELKNLGPYSDNGILINPAQLYFGANAPKLNWNGTNFTITDLHTSMNKGNNQLSDSVLRSDAPYGYKRDLAGEAEVVYKINPKEDFCDFSPVRKPYLGQITLTGYNSSGSGSAATSVDFPTSYFNGNLEAWQLYDSLTGIFIEDFGVTESVWSRSLWGLLGFSYKQFHSNTNTRLSVIDYTNINDLSVITTNSEINEGDQKIYTRNQFGVPLFYNRLPYGGVILDAQGTIAVRFYPEIVQSTQSMAIIAENLPTRMIRGYYTIRSNILQETPFIGGKVNNTTMPIIGIVDKINGDGDFYFGQESSLEFTITRPMRLASITCSIHDPDGSYARCSDQSTVLFKIQKNKNVTFDIAQELLEEQQQKKK
jgi:hypothetical protein